MDAARTSGSAVVGVVPAAPATNDGQTLFLSQGVYGQSDGWVVQSALQWGPSAQASDVQRLVGPAAPKDNPLTTYLGGAYWQIASWARQSLSLPRLPVASILLLSAHIFRVSL